MLVLPPDPAGWEALLADPDKHWKRGRSAWELATSWTSAGDEFPADVGAAFSQVPELQDLEPVVAIAEYQVALAGRGHPSQTDAFVLAYGPKAGLASITVEGLEPGTVLWLEGRDFERADLAALRPYLS